MECSNLLSFDNSKLDSVLLCREKNNLATEVDGDVVLLDLSSNEFVGLDTIGSSIWSHLEDPVSFKGLCQTLMTKYEVVEEVCRADVLEFLQELSQSNLISVQEDHV